MFKNYALSKKPLDFVYAVVWLAIFTAFAVYIMSGAMFQPENGKIHIVAILIGWIAEYIGLVGTAVLVFIIGAYIALRIILVKKQSE